MTVDKKIRLNGMSSKSLYIHSISNAYNLIRTCSVNVTSMINLQSYYVDFYDMHDKCSKYGR